MKKSKIPYFYLGLITALTYIPIIITVIYSFNDSSISSIWGGVSWKWYMKLFEDRPLKEALHNSLVLAFLSATCAVVIGTLGAIGMHRKKSRLNKVVSSVSMIPIMMPEIIMGMVLLSVFSLMGLPFGMVTLVIAHTAFCIPYVYFMVKARLVGMDPALEEAALDLGASPASVFWDITLPLILPAVISGALLCFAMSFDDVVISIFVTGPTVNTLPIKIYTKLKTGVTPEINALAAVMLLVTILILIGAVHINKSSNTTVTKPKRRKL